MRITLTTVLLFLGTYIAVCQNNLEFDWVQVSIGGSSVAVNSIDTDNSGNIFHCGQLRNQGEIDFNAVDSISQVGYSYVSMVDSNGSMLWGNSYFAQNFTPIFDHIKLLNSGEVICVGRFLGEVDFNTNGNGGVIQSGAGYSTFILKLDVGGNFLWCKKIDNLTPSNPQWMYPTHNYVTSIDTDSEDNIILVGNFRGRMDFDTGLDSSIFESNVTLTNDAFVLKLDQHGAFNWVRVFSGYNDESVSAVEVVEEDKLVLSINYFDSIDLSSVGLNQVEHALGNGSLPFPTDGNLILQLNDAGFLEWMNNVYATLMVVNHIHKSSADEILLTGWFEGFLNFNYPIGAIFLEGYGNGTGRDGFVVKLNSQGILQQQIMIGGGNMEVDLSETQILDNEFYIASNIQHGDSLYLNETFAFHPESSGFVLHIDSSLNFLDALEFKHGPVTISDLKFDNSNALISCGQSSSTEQDKIDFDPFENVYYSDEIGIGAFLHRLKQQNTESVYQPDEIVIYPNPSKGVFSINIGPNDAPIELEVFDLSGKLISTEILYSQLNIVDFSSNAKGGYYLVFHLDDSIFRKKIAVY